MGSACCGTAPGSRRRRRRKRSLKQGFLRLGGADDRLLSSASSGFPHGSHSLSPSSPDLGALESPDPGSDFQLPGSAVVESRERHRFGLAYGEGLLVEIHPRLGSHGNIRQEAGRGRAHQPFDLGDRRGPALDALEEVLPMVAGFRRGSGRSPWRLVLQRSVL